MAPEREQGRVWPLLLGPQAFAGWPDGAIFSTLCVLTLLLVSVAEMAAPRPATLGAIAFLPVAASGWLLSRRLTILVVTVALVLRGLAAVVVPVDPITTVAQIITLPVIAVVSRLAA